MSRWDEPRWVESLAIALLFAALAAGLVQVDSDPDIWGRLAYARQALFEHRGFPAVDVYSYTSPGGPWVDHEWAFCWVAYAVDRLAGYGGLRLLRVLPLFATVLLCLGGLRARTPGPRMAAAAAAAVPLAMGFVGPRAQEVSYLFFAWMLFCFRRARGGSPFWCLAAVAPLPVWINLHGGYLAGAGVALTYGAWELVAAARARDARRLRAWLLALGFVAASAFCSRFGPGYVPFLFRTALLDRPFVREWGPPAALSLIGVCWALMLAGSLFAARLEPRAGSELTVLAGVAAVSARHQRHLTFFAIAFLLFALPRIAAWLDARSPPSAPARLWRAVCAACGVGIVALSALTLARAARPPPGEPAFPAGAVKFLRDEHLGGGLLVDFNWAQYAIYELSPQIRVAFDGRYEAVYSPSLQAAYFAWHYGGAGWEELPARPDTRLALVEAESDRAERLSRLPGWRRLYADPTAEVFAKTEPPP